MESDISALERAILRLAVLRLEEAVAAYQADTSQSLIRDGLLQRFEFTWEISHKSLRRYLEANRGLSEIINAANCRSDPHRQPA